MNELEIEEEIVRMEQERDDREFEALARELEWRLTDNDPED